MPDNDFPEILHAPEATILAHCTSIEAGDSKRAGADLRVPAIKPPEKDVGRAIGQLAGFDRIQVVDEEDKDITVGRIERRRGIGNVDIRIVDSR